MLNYLGARLITALIVVFGVMTIVFMLIHIVPGDPVEVMLGESAQAADREALRETLGLNLPLSTQWVNYINGLIHLDLGTSLHTKRPVIDVLTERIPATSLLAGTSILIALMIALPLGMLAAVRKGSIWDRTAMTFSMLGVAIPNFWMGPMLILVFSLWLGWFPVSGNDQFLSLVLPALTLGTALAAILSRMIRASLLEVLNEDYIRAANARGLLPSTVIWKHALKNAALPVVTILGMQLGALLAGAVITETVFSWPGIGQLTIDAIQKRDYPVIQSCVLLISLCYVVVNLLTDLAYAWLDPRISLTE
ncbi:MAG: glutathione ABC transporter permease GsiC [Gammaproteobacteria bacterium]|nr:MAG: glutathione ABC transporter permease GsiC [Gammaproteobacteria bacterium]RKZ72338.1 MAG: glutathione ABC transporter permease GsiC [Gammaproteobacteria bacterium]